MKLTKKILSVVLSVMMVVTMLPTFAVSAFAADSAELNSAIAAYEAKMNGTTYTNMKAAYDAYVTAKKAAEAIKYGDMESYPNVSTYASDLTAKTNAMQAWTWSDGRPTGLYGSYAGDNQNDWASGTGYTTFMTNVLWGETGIDKNSCSEVILKGSGGTGSNSNCSVWLKYPVMTMLYDGTTKLNTPMLIQIKSSGQNRYVYCAFPTTDGLGLENTDVWYGTDQKDNWAWLYSQQKSNDIGQIKASASSGKAAQISKTGGFAGIGNYSNKYYRWANMTKFTGTFAKGEYLKEIRPAYQVYIGSSTTYTATDIAGVATGDEPIRYINFKAVLDSKAKAKGISNISQYSLGGAADYLAAVDNTVAKISAFSLGTYFNGTSNEYTACANAIKGIDETAATIDEGSMKKDTFFNIVAKKGNDTVGVFTLSNGCKAKTVAAALNTVLPESDYDANYHYTYSWPTAADVTANAEYKAISKSTAHTFVDVSVQKAATCESAGIMNIKCSDCAFTSTRDIKATGHAYGDFTADWTEYVDDETVYTHTKTCANDASHKVTENCEFSKWTQDGDNDVRTCANCGVTQTRVHEADKVSVTFELPDGTVVKEETVDPNATVTAPAVETKYDAEGHHSFHWSADSYVITENTVIVAIADEVVAHTTATKNVNFVNVNADLTATSCDTNKTYSYDVVTYCADEACTIELSTVTKNVTPLAHTINADSYKQNTEDNHNIECSVCHAVTGTEKHSYTANVTPSTCQLQGYTTYTCKCGKSYTGDIKPYADHSFGDYINNKNKTHSRICSVCSYEEITSCNLESTLVAPTCTVDGYYTQACTVCDYDSGKADLIFEASELCNTAYPNGIGQTYTFVDNKYNVIKAEKLVVEFSYVLNFAGNNNANNGNLTITGGDGATQSASCNSSASSRGSLTLETNSNTFTLSGANVETVKIEHITIYGASLAAKGHTIVNDKAVTATCTEDGLTAGTHCSVCNEVIKAQTVVKATGHTYKDTVVAPTETAQGYTEHKCSKCNDTYKDNYVATFVAFDKAYAALTDAIANKEADDTYYTYASLVALKDVVDNSTCIKLTTDEKNVYDPANQAIIDAETAAINNAVNALETVKVDVTAFNDARTDIKNKVSDPDAWNGADEAYAYVDDVENGLFEKVTILDVELDGITKGQDVVDNFITTALEMVQPQEYTVYLDGVAKETVPFGTTVTVPLTVKSDVFYAYKSNTYENGKKYFCTDERVTFVVKGDTFLTTAPVENTTEQHKVTFVSGKNNRVISVAYVNDGEDVELPTAPSIPFHTFDGYQIDGVAFDGKNITSDVTVSAIYTAQTKTVTVTYAYINDDNEVVKEIDAQEYQYNDKIELKKDDAIYWAVISADMQDAWEKGEVEEGSDPIENVVATGTSYTFYAHEDVVVISLNQAAYDYDVENGLIGTEEEINKPTVTTATNYVDASTKISFVSSYFNGEYEVVEAGLLVAKKSGLDLTDITKTTVDGNQVYRLKSSQHTAGNQFVISLSTKSMPAGQDFSLVAYMIYKDADGNQQIVYGNNEQVVYTK